MLKVDNEKREGQFKKSNIETKLDQYGNKMSMFETVNEVYEDTVANQGKHCWQGSLLIHSDQVMLSI